MNIFWGLAIPFVGTTLGSAMCFLMKNTINKKLEKVLLGFASGVMIAASVWSLIMPSVEMAEAQNIVSWLPAAVRFFTWNKLFAYTRYSNSAFKFTYGKNKGDKI